MSLLTADQVAEQLQVSTSYVYAMRQRNQIGFVRLGTAIRFPQSEIDKFVTAATVQAVR